MMAVVERLIEGWGAIADLLTAMGGIDVTKDAARRWACRKVDPLPARRVGRMKRPRIVADPRKLEAWATREFT